MKRTMLLVAIVVSVLSLFGCAKETEDAFVVKIGSEKVYTPEFRFYFLFSQIAYENEGGPDIWLTRINGVKAEDVAKERTFESIARVKISGAQADSLGISLSDEDLESAAERREALTGTFSVHLEEIGITQELLQSIVEEGIIYQKVYGEVTKDVQISERDFAAYLEGYIRDTGLDAGAEEDLEDFSETARIQYTEMVKNNVFEERYSKWEAETPTEKNQEIWDSIHILSK